MFNQPTLVYYFSKLLSAFSWQWHGFRQIRWFYDFDRLLLCLQWYGVVILTDSCCICRTVVWTFWQTPVAFAGLWYEDFDRCLLFLQHCGMRILTDLCLQHCGVKILTDTCFVCSTMVWWFWVLSLQWYGGKNFDRLVLCLQHCSVRILTDLCCLASLWCEDFDRLVFAGLWCKDFDRLLLQHCGVKILTDSSCVCSTVAWRFWQTPVAALWCEEFDRLLLQHCGVKILTDSCCSTVVWRFWQTPVVFAALPGSALSVPCLLHPWGGGDSRQVHQHRNHWERWGMMSTSAFFHRALPQVDSQVDVHVRLYRTVPQLDSPCLKLMSMSACMEQWHRWTVFIQMPSMPHRCCAGTSHLHLLALVWHWSLLHDFCPCVSQHHHCGTDTR